MATDSSVFSDKKLSDLGLPDWLLENCARVGLKKATLIQKKGIPAIFAGKDVIGRAKTGSGKTAAFALPILTELSEDPYGIFALVLTPTRELACQIGDQFSVLCDGTGFRSAIVYGGSGMITNTGEVEDRPHILISTPGRLADLLRGGMEFPVEDLRYLVIDECDALLLNSHTDYSRDLKLIFDRLPAVTSDGKRRQTLLFSATVDGKRMQEMSRSVLALDSEHLTVIETSKYKLQSVDNILQTYAFIPELTKEAFLIAMLKSTQFKNKSTIVFVSSKDYCQVISLLLRKFGIKVSALHSRLRQIERIEQLYRFRQGKSKIMVCTDVASRGLDIAQCQVVVNFDVPRKALEYVHRIGRCGRVDRHGLAVTMVSQFDIELLRSIERAVLKGTVLSRLRRDNPELTKAQVKSQLLATREQKNKTYAKYSRMPELESAKGIENDGLKMMETVLIKRAQVINDLESKYLLTEDSRELKKHPAMRRRQRGYVDPRLTRPLGSAPFDAAENGTSEHLAKRKSKRKRSQFSEDMAFIKKMKRVGKEFEQVSEAEEESDNGTLEPPTKKRALVDISEIESELSRGREKQMAAIIHRHKTAKSKPKAKKAVGSAEDGGGLETMEDASEEMFGWDTFRYGKTGREFHSTRRRVRVLERTNKMKKRHFEERMDDEKRRRKRAKRAERLLGTAETAAATSDSSLPKGSVRTMARELAAADLFEMEAGGFKTAADDSKKKTKKTKPKAAAKSQKSKPKAAAKTATKMKAKKSSSKSSPKKTKLSRTLKKLLTKDEKQQVKQRKQQWFSAGDKW